MLRIIFPLIFLFTTLHIANAASVSAGPRPAFLIDQMDDGPLKEKLAACIAAPVTATKFSIGHRGAPLQFPEHTRESYIAAARMGAGIIECDVTFTKDQELVCRHAQNDLHTTTNILATDLASTCVKPFAGASGDDKASAECRASEISLAEFRTLNGKMDAANRNASDVNAYINGTAKWRTDLYANAGGTLMTHSESITLFKSLGVMFTPELKSPSVEMPFNGLSQQAYAQKMIDDYKAAGVPPAQVWPQSFSLDDVLYWISAEPEFGKQAVWLDGRYRSGIDPSDASTFMPTMQELKDMGVNYIAPPLWMLLAAEGDKIVPSEYAMQAKAAGLNMITWTLERSGSLKNGGGWYYQTVKPLINDDSDMFTVLDVLAQDVGVKGVFSDWPATVSYYASCMGLD